MHTMPWDEFWHLAISYFTVPPIQTKEWILNKIYNINYSALKLSDINMNKNLFGDSSLRDSTNILAIATKRFVGPIVT